MENGRKLLFALIGTAMMLNIGYGLVNNGVFPPVIKNGSTYNDGDTSLQSFFMSGLNGGSTFTTSYNMTVDARLEGEVGSYVQQGTITRTVNDNSISRSLSGTYDLGHSVNGTKDISFKGSMISSRTTETDENGFRVQELLDSHVTISGPKGIGSSSDVKTTVRQFGGLKTDMIWKAIIPDDGILKPNSTGNVSIELDLQEAGIDPGEVMISWEVASMKRTIEGMKAYLHCSSDLSGSTSLDMTLELMEDCGWPCSYEVMIMTSFMTDEGKADVSLFVKEILRSHAEGSGNEIPLIIYDPLGPPEPTSGVNIIPEEGGETCFRSVPAEVMDFCLSEGTILSGYLQEHGWDGLSLKEARYYRVDSVDSYWMWNITFSTPVIDGISDLIGFEVRVEGGGLIDQKIFHLISESRDFGFIHPDPERPLISLKENEIILQGSESAEHLFRGDEYSNSFRLDILIRGKGCIDTGSMLFMNLLGVEKAQVMDLFISSAVDRKDPSRMFIVVVDASSGELISTTEFEGAVVPLFNSYGFDLA